MKTSSVISFFFHSQTSCSNVAIQPVFEIVLDSFSGVLTLFLFRLEMKQVFSKQSTCMHVYSEAREVLK